MVVMLFSLINLKKKFCLSSVQMQSAFLHQISHQLMCKNDTFAIQLYNDTSEKPPHESVKIILP